MKKSRDYRQLLANMLEEWKWLFGYIVRYKFVLGLYIILGLLATAMSLGVSVATKYLIDTVVSHASDRILKYALLVVGLAVFQLIFQSVTSWLTATVSTKTNNEIRREIYSRIIKANWEDIRAFHSGDLLNRLESDVSAVSAAVINFVPSVFTRFVQFFGSLFIVLYYDKTMALFALMSAPFLFLSSRMLIKTMRRYSKQTREINGNILSYTEESVQNIQIIKAFDLTKEYIGNFCSLLENYRKVRLSYDKFSIIMTLCFSLIGLVVSYTCYGWGVYRLWQGAITYGTMTLFLQISGSLTASFGSLASLAPSAISIATAAGRIMEVTGFEREEDARREEALALMEKARDKGVSLVLENVSFRYSDADTPVLNDISVRLNAGETVAFVGPSGEGKTTLFKLILGLVKPTQGRIYLEAPDGETLEISDSTRRFCSYVPQNINVFSGTIYENLSIIKPEATGTELEAVLREADLYNLVSSLPDGMDTPVNEQGANFSQGQLQRLAIARALLRKAMLLLMDEATSALDVETEKRVLENIMVSEAQRLCIITTHRESMLRYCDRIFKITEQGTLTENSQAKEDTV